MPWTWPKYTRGTDPQDYIPGRYGYVAYAFCERPAICLESGIHFAVAFRTACAEQLTDIARRVPSGPR